MREESHLEDMRAAIRGDFQRLEERRGEQVLLRPETPPTVEAPAPLPEAETIDEPAAAVGPPEADPEPEPEADPAPPAPEPAPEPVQGEPETEVGEPESEPRRRSWLDRLLGR